MILLLIPLNPSWDSSFVEYPRLFSNIPVSLYVSGCTPVANEACSAGRVLVNGKAAKAGTNVKPGDRIDIQFGNRETAVEVVSIAETVKKDEAADLYKFL